MIYFCAFILSCCWFRVRGIFFIYCDREGISAAHFDEISISTCVWRLCGFESLIYHVAKATSGASVPLNMGFIDEFYSFWLLLCYVVFQCFLDWVNML